MAPPTKHTGLEPWEQTLIKIWDRIDGARLRSSARAADVLAKRALGALDGGSMDKLLALAQQLRNDAELGPNAALAKELNSIVKDIVYAMSLSEGSAAAADDTGDTTDADRAALTMSAPDANDTIKADMESSEPEKQARARWANRQRSEELTKIEYRKGWNHG